MNLLRYLKAGDVLLYEPVGFFGMLIAWKTWHKVSHVEAYIGDGFSVASRDGIGVGKYPWRNTQLVAVCRPIQPFNLFNALIWFQKQKGTPYGWGDLLQFFGLNVNGKGIVCSPFVARFLRNGGLDPFNGEPAEKIAPFQFELSPVFQVYEVTNDGQLSPRTREVDSSAS